MTRVRWRRSPRTAGAAAVLALTLVAVCAAIVAIGHLQTASAQARDAQLRLTALRLDVAQVQDVPWGAAPGGDDPADVRDELTYDAQAIRRSIARPQARQKLPDGPAIDRPLNRSLAALWEIFRLVSHGRHDRPRSRAAGGRPADVRGQGVRPARAHLWYDQTPVARRSPDPHPPAAAGWQQDLADALIEAGVEVAAWVPDKRLEPVASQLARRGLPLRTLTREEECFGYAAGHRAAGGMPLVLIQCSGLGNSLNAIGSLVIPYGLGFPVVISMRGTLGERNPAQMPLGRSTAALLEALGVQPFPLARPEAAATVARGAMGVAEGARVLAPILLAAELELA